MPRATNNIEDVTRFDLQTLEGGYVELRRMTYGQYLKRQGMAMDMQMRSQGKNQGNVMDIDISQEKVTEFEFAICLAGHNLEDDSGALLDFKKPHCVQLLDPRIGQEIGDLINTLNTWEDKETGN